MLFAGPNPMLASLQMSRTCGNSCRTMSGEPSREMLSTTMVSAANPSDSCSAVVKQRRRRSRVLKEIMMMERSIADSHVLPEYLCECGNVWGEGIFLDHFLASRRTKLPPILRTLDQFAERIGEAL